VSPDAPRDILHASSVAVDGRGVLIRGAAGSGKSTLALALLALGGVLIADDRTVVALRDGRPWLSAPDTIRGRIEARGIGILNAGAITEAPLALVVDMDRGPPARLPEPETIAVFGHHVEVISGQQGGHFPAALRHYLLYGRSD